MTHLLKYVFAAVLLTGAAHAAPIPSTSATTSYHRAEVDGVGLFYREAGPKDAPTIVLLHGFPSSSREFAPLIPLLATHYHLIAPDFPGFGQSDAPPPAAYAYTFDHLAETTADLLDTLKISSYTLYIHDYGAPIGFRIILVHPDRLHALITQNGNVEFERRPAPKGRASRMSIESAPVEMSQKAASRRAEDPGGLNHFLDPPPYSCGMAIPEDQIAGWSLPVRQLYDHWRAMHPAEGVLPGRQHFDPLDVPYLMPLVWMLDVVRNVGTIRFRYRLLGTRHVRAMTRDYTGRWMDEAHANFIGHPYYAHYLQVCAGHASWRRGRPGFHVHSDYYEMERVMLPLARDGATVDMILAITVYFDKSGNQAA